MGIEREVRLAAKLQHPRVVHTVTQLGTALGTRAYMVAEQVTGEPTMGHRAELSALGVRPDEPLVGRILRHSRHHARGARGRRAM
jgi:hypothetical protein